MAYDQLANTTNMKRDLYLDVYTISQIKQKPKGMVLWTHKITISVNFNTEILMLSKTTILPKSTVELGYICPRVLLGLPAVTLTK